MLAGRAPSPVRHTSFTSAVEAGKVLKQKYEEKHTTQAKVAIFEMTHYIDESGNLKKMEPF
jgi:hypothetical protein